MDNKSIISILSCMDPELYDVVVHDRIERFKAIDKNLSVNKYDQLTPTNNTVLHVACQHRNCESPTFGGPDGRTALHAAVLDKARASMELLLKKRKDLIKVADNYGWTVYHYVAYNDLHAIVKYLVDVEYPDRSVGNLSDIEHKRTPLHVAAYEGKAKWRKTDSWWAKVDWQVLDVNNFTPLDVLQMTDSEQAGQAIVRRVFNRHDVKRYWNPWRIRKKVDREEQRDKNRSPDGKVKRFCYAWWLS
ncbi:hypothetical protein POM88_035238 [Heracleum sosnowskyi]|uniref:Uncharacterized protein n=1 Tax=Heracleum sosnowskyi TaxID=360622 RepID=A0AAD8HM28_9APIA|nr:hypothetical protein POM88_035238 [Heracleum sosnowskyi]